LGFFSQNFKYSSTVAELRKAIEQKTGIKADAQRLTVGTYPPRELVASANTKITVRLALFQR
jgi:hypothetical protein